jgi:hypothetical protein
VRASVAWVSATLRIARSAPRPNVTMGWETENTSRQVRDGWNSPAGVTYCGSNETDAVGSHA